MEPFIGEIRLMSFAFPPRGWAQCNGQLLSIAQNQALFSIIGTTYGGNGTTTFALPDLRGRVPIHPDSSVQRGQYGGEEAHILSIAEMPAHHHTAQGSTDNATTSSPVGQVWASPSRNIYSDQPVNGKMSPSAIASAGGNVGHTNMQPYTVTNYCIALQGIYPIRN